MLLEEKGITQMFKFRFMVKISTIQNK
ncbi:hypothetical protein C5167_018259 [Papaver somniferum]|uniref:Uncharacterized protein n=1 Tax=Papaver somniferum TaxID=3469 RepID=A0A4Y7ILS1_PAPSO|nr:hypothetical protein C5167_018259 [Papaver somniferum]